MKIPTEPKVVAEVLEGHGISLTPSDLEALCIKLTADARLFDILATDVDHETLPALQPWWSTANTAPSPASRAAKPDRTGAIQPTQNRLSPVEAVEAALKRIEANPDESVFTEVFADSARKEAERLEAGPGDDLPLWGTTVAVKDLMNVAGHRMTGGSRSLSLPVTRRDAEVVSRLRRAGAVVIGAANLHELAFGTTGENPHFGSVGNPAARGRMAGGSSGGSAAAVGFGMATFGIGTDTGGSIRIPAACCGVVGLKPSFNLVPLDGVHPLGYSLDHVGPLTETVTDAARVLDVLVDRPGTYTQGLEAPLRGVTLGVPTGHFFIAQEGVAEVVEAVIKKGKAAGAQVVPLSLEEFDRSPAAYLGSSGAEAIAIHYRTLVESGDRLGADVRIRLAAALFIPAFIRVKAQQLRSLMFDELSTAFRSADVILTPTLPVGPPPAGSAAVRLGDERIPTSAAFLRNTCPFNLTGVPAISIPCGRDAEGIPVGLQIVGPQGGDRRVLQVARAFEREVI